MDLLKIAGLVVLAVIVLAFVVRMVTGGVSIDPKFKPLNVQNREPMPLDQLFREYFEGQGPFDKELIRSVLEFVAELSTIPADRLRLEDGLGEIAAVSGLKRAMLIGSAVARFEEAGPAISKMMLAGKMTNLSQLVVTVALATAEARARTAASRQEVSDSEAPRGS